MRVELLGKKGENVGHVDVPAEAPDIVGLQPRFFIRDEKAFYPGVKYVEATFFQIERRAEGARGSEKDRKAAGA